MRKVIFVFIIVALGILCYECEIRNIQFGNYNEHAETNPEPSEPKKEEPVDNSEAIADIIANYKEIYETEHVFVDSLNPISYMAIKDGEIIMITKTNDIDLTKRIQRSAISTISGTCIGTLNQLTIKLLDGTSVVFNPTTVDSDLIIHLLGER